MHHRRVVYRVEARLERLLTNHPVREQFTAMVRRGDIALADVGEEGNAAEFAIVDAARVSGGRPGQSGHVMALSISWSQLSDPEKNDAWWTLVLYHEYVHFIQYRDGHQPAGTFMMNSLDLSSPDQVEKQCTQKRHAEEDAYHQECELAVARKRSG